MTGPGSYAAISRRSWLLALPLAVLWLVALTACGSSSSSPAGIAGPSEVASQPISTKGPSPFTDSVGKDRAGVRPPAAAASASGGPATYAASTPGLYGGTRNYTTCNATQLVTYLQQNPTKAYAWATTMGIKANQISDYVSKLTSVLLRTDTRVTNHGYVNGQATGYQAVLEAGTAVMVDQYGKPVVKCYCGNPLTGPTLLASPTYTGPTWEGFSTTNITIIQQSTTIINQYTLYDPSNGMIFNRTPGANGTDSPYQPAPGSMVNPTPMANPTPSPSPSPSPSPTPSPSGAPSGPASVSLSPNPVTAGDTVTLSGSGFAPNSSVSIDVHRPDGGNDSPRSATADSQGNVSYTFPNAGGSLTGSYTVTVSDSAGHTASASITVVPRGGGSGSPPTPGGTHTT